MKKNIIRITALFLCAITVFLSTPFNSLKTVKAANSWDNFIDFIRTNTGQVYVSGSNLLSSSRDDFYGMLYFRGGWVWSYDGSDFTFDPTDIFTKSEWVALCNTGTTTKDIRFQNFNIKDCLQKSGYFTDTGVGYDLSTFPKLADSQDTVSPLEGVKVISDFSGYDNFLQESYYSSDNITFFDTLKADFLSNYDNLILFTGRQVLPTLSTSSTAFISFTVPVDYIYFCNTNNKNYIYYHTDNQFYSAYQVPSFYAGSNSGNSSYSWVPTSSNLGRISSPSYTFSHLNISASSGVIPSLSGEYKVWSSSIPVVIASTPSYGQQYYTWLNGSPSGDFYTSSNISNNTYSYDYVNNNNWEEIYNNYVTDVSNYYSTTENITNQQLSQYIDQSTTITNITNNYITNGGGGSGDDIITNSWLERIYNKLVEIKSILISGHDPDTGDTYYTDNSIKNEIIEYPTSDLFPDVPSNNFISTAEDFTIDLFASKMSAIISEVIPFCYLEILKSTSLALAAPPSAPYWEIPFQIDRLNIDETVVLDMTGEEWDSVHNVWITLFMIIFVSFLFYLTYRVVLLVSNLFA